MTSSKLLQDMIRCWKRLKEFGINTNNQAQMPSGLISCCFQLLFSMHFTLCQSDDMLCIILICSVNVSQIWKVWGRF